MTYTESKSYDTSSAHTVPQHHMRAAKVKEQGDARPVQVPGGYATTAHVYWEFLKSNELLARQFGERFDGFAIGSNDLTQLVLGVDRDSGRLSALLPQRHKNQRSHQLKSRCHKSHAGIRLIF